MISSRVADRLAHRRDDRHALVEPVARDPHLDRAEALLDQRQGVLGALAGRPQLAPRGVGGHPSRGAAEQRRHRPPARLADQVPQRRLQRPVAPGVE